MLFCVVHTDLIRNNCTGQENSLRRRGLTLHTSEEQEQLKCIEQEHHLILLLDLSEKNIRLSQS
jgi:hypothetical protein